MKHSPRILGSLFAILLAGCAASAEGDAADGNDIDAEIAARQGEEVDRVCFARSINGWRSLGRRSILIEKGVNDWYKLDLIGTCDPQWAFDAIAIRTRPAGASCLRRGDRIDTPDRSVSGSCAITKIYRWNEAADEKRN